MARLQLRVYRSPGYAETFLQIKGQDNQFAPRVAVIDTGAQITLLPMHLLETIEYRLTQRGNFTIDQAGIAKQSFEAIEAEITVYLEDLAGNRSPEFVVPAWFAQTDKSLIGFGGILEQAIFHLDMPHLSGYLEFPDPSPA